MCVPAFPIICLYTARKPTFVNGLDCARLYTSRDPAAAPAQIATIYPGAHKGALLSSFVDEVLGRGRAEVTQKSIRHLAVCFAIEKSAHSAHRCAWITGGDER
jgi:hypothetical protein